jgi:hypothetical protein
MRVLPYLTALVTYAAGTSTFSPNAAAAAPFVPSATSSGSVYNTYRPAAMSSAAAPFVPRTSGGNYLDCTES